MGSGFAERGADEARFDQADLDAERRRLEAQGVSEGLHRVLARVVVAADREDDPSSHRTDVDDAAPARPAHARKDELSHPGESEDIDS